jgi:hypothetical protein
MARKRTQQFVIVACKKSVLRAPMMLPGLYDVEEAARAAAARLVPDTHSFDVIERPR